MLGGDFLGGRDDKLDKEDGDGREELQRGCLAAFSDKFHEPLEPCNLSVRGWPRPIDVVIFGHLHSVGEKRGGSGVVYHHEERK